MISSIQDAWVNFIGRVQESRRYVVEDETNKNAKDELAADLDGISIPRRIYVYTRILRRYEDHVNHEWRVSSSDSTVKQGPSNTRIIEI